jgi:hypothetical protein
MLCIPAGRAPQTLASVFLLAALALTPAGAFAGQADVLRAEVTCGPAPGGRPASICRFSATVAHGDTGWDHFANRWDVVDAEGNVLASRQLRHPHIDEQPFERSLGRVRIPHATKSVTIRANDSVHGLGGAEVIVVVPHTAPSGPRAGDASPPAP